MQLRNGFQGKYQCSLVHRPGQGAVRVCDGRVLTGGGGGCQQPPRQHGPVTSREGQLCICFLKDMILPWTVALGPLPIPLLLSTSLSPNLCFNSTYLITVGRNLREYGKVELQEIQVQVTQIEMYIINIGRWVFQPIQNRVSTRNLSPGS